MSVTSWYAPPDMLMQLYFPFHVSGHALGVAHEILANVFLERIHSTTPNLLDLRVRISHQIQSIGASATKWVCVNAFDRSYLGCWISKFLGRPLDDIPNVLVCNILLDTIIKVIRQNSLFGTFMTPNATILASQRPDLTIVLIPIMLLMHTHTLPTVLLITEL